MSAKKIPSGWAEKKLSDICDVDKCSLKSNTPDGFKFKYISLSDVDKGHINSDLVEYSFKEAPSRARRIVTEGDVMLATVRPNLEAFAQIKSKSSNLIASTGFAVLTPKFKGDTEYIYQLLYSNDVKRQIHSLVVGSNYPAISSADVRNLRVIYPEVPEERFKISTILAKWDDAIEKSKKLVILKKKEKNIYEQKIFKHLMDTKKLCSLDSVFLRVTRKNTDGRCFNVLTISAQNGLVSQTDFFNKNVSSEKLTGYYLINKGEFAYNKSYSNGYPMGAIKPLEFYASGVLSPLYICFKLKDKTDTNVSFYKHFFESGFFDRAISTIAQEGARNHGLLNISVLDFFKLPIPDVDDLTKEKVSRVFDSIDREIFLLTTKHALLKQQKFGLMSALLDAKKRVAI